MPNPSCDEQQGRKAEARVLVIERDREVRADLRRMLEDSGYRVFSTAHTADGLRLLVTAQPDAVLLDAALAAEESATVERIEQTSDATLLLVAPPLVART